MKRLEEVTLAIRYIEDNLTKKLDLGQIAEAVHYTYRTEYDRSLLYIACTRAMHKLTLTFTGKQTELIMK